MHIKDVGNLCLWCMECMGDSPYCPHCGHDEREVQRVEQAIPAGSLIGGHYLIGKVLGQGGFGITYLAYDLDLHVKRAIKEYFPQGLVMRVGNMIRVSRKSMEEAYQKGVDSFYREAQSIVRFGSHPNIVQVHAFFRENGTAYFVMDYVEGISFQQYLNDRGGHISWEEALHILKPIGNALTALHEAHLLHRDVKPDNIFITQNGTPKLLDFGAARYETSETTHSSVPVMTPGYAPVEQYGSMSRQGPFTDVYAFAATFYRAVSGVVPIPSPDRMMEDPLIPLDKVDSRVPAHISAALSRGMSVRSEKRTQSVEQLLTEMETRTAHSGFPKWLLPVLAVLLAIFAGGVLAFWMQKGNSSVNTDAADNSISETQDAVSATQTAWESLLPEASAIPTETMAPIVDYTQEALQMTLTAIAEVQMAFTAQAETEAAQPTATATSTATKIPTATATSTATAKPTASKIPTATAKPTATKIPTAVPADRGKSEPYVKRYEMNDIECMYREPVDENGYRTKMYLHKRDEIEVLTWNKSADDQLWAEVRNIVTGEQGWIDQNSIQTYSIYTDNFKDLQAGDHLYFGSYEQDGNTGNGTEPIEWRVLDRQGDRLLLLSEKILDVGLFNNDHNDNNWVSCTLRTRMNDEFYNQAFNASEKKQIALTNLMTNGNSSQDYVFLLSTEELDQYLPSTEDRECKITELVASRQKFWDYGDDGNWRLRSPSEKYDFNSLYINIFGELADISVWTDYEGIRPAIWMTL